MEIWKTVAGWKYYQVSNKGQVRSLDRWILFSNGQHRFFKGCIQRGWLVGSYRAVWLCNGRKASAVKLVHVLVCTVFNGEKPSSAEVCRHLDDDPSNNTPENLVWGTHQDNAVDALRNGNIPYAQKLTVEQAAYIRNSKLPPTKLAALFCVSKMTIWRVRSRRSWCNR